MLRVLRLSAATSLALAATVMGASAAGAATHGHKPGNCSVKKKKVTVGNYHAVAVTVVCTSHGGVSQSTVVSPNGHVTVSHSGGKTIVRDSAGNVSDVSAGVSSSQGPGSDGWAVSSASAVSSVSSSQSSSQSSP